MSLTIDRQAFVEHHADGQERPAASCGPRGRVWGMPPYAMRNLPGYDPDVASSRGKARQIMERIGYGPISG